MFTINFSEPVTGLTAAAIAVTNGTAGALKDFVNSGGSLAIFPGNDPDPASWSALLAQFGAFGPGAGGAGGAA